MPISSQLPFPQPSALDVAPQLRALQLQGPIHRVLTPVGDEAWLITSMALLFAGHEITAVRIGHGALMLLANRDEWEKLLDNPALIPNAVEELMRATSTGGGVGGLPRYAKTELDIDGVAIRRGDLVLLDIGSANQDPAAFGDPDHVDVTRRATTHLGFGHDAHYRIGAPLARIELKTVFAQLIPRFPTMRLTVDPTAITLRSDVLAGGLDELPVSW